MKERTRPLWLIGLEETLWGFAFLILSIGGLSLSFYVHVSNLGGSYKKKDEKVVPLKGYNTW
jgi:hypothetical protein